MQGVDDDKVRARVAGREAADEMLALVLEESAALSRRDGPEAGVTFLNTLLDALANILPKKEPEVPETREPETVWESTVKLCDEILADCDELLNREDLDAGSKFLSSVHENVGNIRAGVLRRHWVSLAQQEALQNMHRGVLRWK